MSTFTNSITRLICICSLGLICFSQLGVSVRAADDPLGRTAQESGQEQELLAVLRSDAPPAEKAITCKLLAIHGSNAAVADLARLLPDPELSSWARIALEAIPGEDADAALRQAAGSVEGRLLVGVLNSIGVRQDEAAVELLTARLQDADTAVATAAAVALGHVGNAPATQALRTALATSPGGVRSAVAEGCVLCAERLWAAGETTTAAEIYDEVRAAEVPKQRVIEATRGAILARGPAGIPLLLEQLRSDDKGLFQVALMTAREFDGGEVDRALAAELQTIEPARAALIITAMADRPRTIVLDAVIRTAKSGAGEARLAAVQALGKVGDATCLPVLLEAAVDKLPEIALAAENALASVGGEQVDRQIVQLLQQAQNEGSVASSNAQYALLLALVGQRRIDAIQQLLDALNNRDAAVRAAALKALGETVSLARLSVLIDQFLSPRFSEDAEAAAAALRAASVRMPDRDACATELAEALNRAPAASKTKLLEILAEMGGPKALQIVASAAKSSDPNQQDDGSRLLGKWNSVEAAPALLDLAKTAPVAKYQVRALRGYLGLARKFDMPEVQRVAMCRQALDLAQRDDERELALSVLEIHPSIEGLELAVKTSQDPELKQVASRTATVIASKVRGKRAEVRKLLSAVGLEKVDLEIVRAEYGAGSVRKDVTALLRKFATDSPLVSLPASSYNASFGGDPAPGNRKKLTIEYRINGKSGQVTLEENAAILLPMPE